MRSGWHFKSFAHPAAWALCALTLALSGCIHSAGLTGVGANALPPAPTTPGAVVTDEYICLPHAEAAELLLWIEHAEAQCR